MKISKLTDLANKHTALNLKILSRESVDWLKENVRKLRNARSISNGIVQEPGRPTTRLTKGKLFFFKYDPKHAETLPYYDTFPLVIVLEQYTGESAGFLGLNLHYLPIKMRAAFLDQLLSTAAFDKSGDVVKINMINHATAERTAYEILSTTKKYRAFEPCLKRYLFSHMRSPLLQILPHEWETAVFLPVEQFQKVKQQSVQAKSLQTIKDSATNGK